MNEGEFPRMTSVQLMVNFVKPLTYARTPATTAAHPVAWIGLRPAVVSAAPKKSISNPDVATLSALFSDRARNS